MVQKLVAFAVSAAFLPAADGSFIAGGIVAFQSLPVRRS
jgi:hypothetical protein